MSRWDYDVVFYRVFCFGLLSLVLIFTVILTNVFIDIDGILNRKTAIETSTIQALSPRNIELDDSKTVEFEDKEDDSEEPSYRTKRSIERESIKDVKNFGYKTILTSRLASLLEELDKEEAAKEEITSPDETTIATVLEIKKKSDTRKKDLLHLAMHNVLLQGILEHKDLNEVYKKIQELVKIFSDISEKKEQAEKQAKILEAIASSKELIDLRIKNSFNEEHTFLDEIINCKQLEKDIAQQQKLNLCTTKSIVTDDNRDKKMFIKTVIEITERDNKLHDKNKTLKGNIEALIKLIYNGELIKVSQMKDDSLVSVSPESLDVETVTANIENHYEDKSKPKKIKSNNNQHKQNILNKLIEEYYNMHPHVSENAEIQSIKTRRLKRQVKIRYLDDSKTTIQPTFDKEIKDDDDLYIEIETHYDGKGVIGEKKKKLVRSLIEKIQKALHSDMEETQEKSEDIKFIKRTQDPIDLKSFVSINKMTPPSNAIEKRQLDPIDKTFDSHDLFDSLGEPWKKEIEGPKFLSISKSVNSAEMGEINVNYDSILKNGIPKRLQVPLNFDVVDENNNTTSEYNDPSNVTLFLKDIDGTGFSIGINQYVGGPPDKDSMNMFNGLQSLLKEYHQSYDQDISNESNMDNSNNFVDEKHEITKRQVKDHKIRQSLTKVKTRYKSYYTTILKKGAFPVQKYINIYKRNNDNILSDDKDFANSNYKLNITNTNVLSENLNIRVPFRKEGKSLNKNVTSQKISPFNISRGKRSINVKKVSNMKSKIRLNRYLNTKVIMAKKKLFLKNKRNKRQINEMRIVQGNHPHIGQKSSDEKLFLISKENTYSDVREIETPQRIIGNDNQDYDDIFPISDEYKTKQRRFSSASLDTVYDGRRSKNNLMSRYPHIFIDEITRFKENSVGENTLNKNERSYRIQPTSKQNIGMQKIEITTLSDIRESKVDEIINAILPSSSKTKYKVTLKVSPKNMTSIGAGFKEIHTSVNKSFDENGLRYFSLVNVSQVSKIEKINETKEILRKYDAKPLNNHLKTQHKQIKTLLELHKKRVDQQLENLLQESQHLEQMIEMNSKNNISKVTNILRDEVITEKNNDKIDEVLNSIKKLQETYQSITKEKTTATTDKIETKLQLIDTIKSNERITYAILKKIDSNTNILKNFLLMFSEKFESDKKNKSETMSYKERKFQLKNDLYYVPSKTNNTVPFVYEYKQHTTKKNVPQTDHADINTIGNVEEKYNKPRANVSNINNMRILNESRFFMDEIENDFKLVPNNKQFIGDITINGTNV